MQLALVGSMAHDDPEGWEYWNQTVAYADGDPDIFILSNLNNVGSVEVNAFQVHSAAVIQKSIREGFGLTVSEALWKGRPTVAGRVGGIVTQIEDGGTGWLVDSSEECAAACIEVLADPGAAHAACAPRQGARAQALPDAASPARPARALQPARRPGDGRRARRRSPRSARPAPDTFHPCREAEADRRREPRPGWVRRTDDGGRITKRGGGGLVTALRSLVTQHDVTWIGSAMSDEDRAVAAEHGEDAFDETFHDGSPYRLRLVAHDAARMTGSTTSSRIRRSGSSSTTCGASPTSPISTPRSMLRGRAGYVPVNEGFAAAVSAELERDPARRCSSTTTTSISRRRSCCAASECADDPLHPHPVAGHRRLVGSAGGAACRGSRGSACERRGRPAHEPVAVELPASCADILGAEVDSEASTVVHGAGGRSSRAIRSASIRTSSPGCATTHVSWMRSG